MMLPFPWVVVALLLFKTLGCGFLMVAWAQHKHRHFSTLKFGWGGQQEHLQGVPHQKPGGLGSLGHKESYCCFF